MEMLGEYLAKNNTLTNLVMHDEIIIELKEKKERTLDKYIR